MAIARHINEIVAGSSFIRKMFETGRELKAIHGENAVSDFSLGNPSLPPPAVFTRVLTELAGSDFPGKHSYMPNPGYPDVREAVSGFIATEHGLEIPPDRIIMTCGAGGGLNVILKTLLNPGDEVVVPLPCFMEYTHYCANHGGTLVTVECTESFGLDLGALEAVINKKTAAVLINSPNNPSGVVYSRSELEKLAELLERKSAETGRTIYLVSDEPYRKIAFDIEVPSPFLVYRNSIVVTSYSKELSIPGERIGWLAIHPEAEDAEAIFNGAAICNRILGYVNAPALMQKAIAACIGASVEAGIYKAKRDLLCSKLREIGYEFILPQGTFYLFPKAPGGDDMKAVEVLRKHLVLVVPGRGFGKPGYFRIAFCVSDDVIHRSIPGFTAAFAELTEGSL